MSVKFAARTDPGAVRTNNEDSFSVDNELGLYMVADGMGGHAAGEVAAAIAINQTHSYIAAGVPLADAIARTHKDIVAASNQHSSGMGSTAVALLDKGDNYEVNWVGDSRAYVYSYGSGQHRLERISHDHSFVQTLVDKGSISEQEARNHPQRNIITQCLGNKLQAEVSVGVTKGSWRANQWLLLCSDGLTGEMEDRSILQILSSCTNSTEAVNRLIDQAIQFGGADNITVVIVESPKHLNYGQALIQKIKAALFPASRYS
ncbi:PP2C family protein-serine/threonine phosphatase [Halioxenophilus aromaticivorans]|uniref:Protein phosphatase 2C domain-containing protein n=1 Tax=Halioxenophilus aromaticivorans TaxID=1306992 RepID=A0AAV3TZ06_9ALTE